MKKTILKITAITLIGGMTLGFAESAVNVFAAEEASVESPVNQNKEKGKKGAEKYTDEEKAVIEQKYNSLSAENKAIIDKYSKMKKMEMTSEEYKTYLEVCSTILPNLTEEKIQEKLQRHEEKLAIPKEGGKWKGMKEERYTDEEKVVIEEKYNALSDEEKAVIDKYSKMKKTEMTAEELKTYLEVCNKIVPNLTEEKIQQKLERHAEKLASINDKDNKTDEE